MKNTKMLIGIFRHFAMFILLFMSTIPLVASHCDTMNGPVIPEAKAALEKGDVTPVLKWVKKENEEEIRTAFAKALLVRAKGSEAKELADRYFLETLIRLHRAGEGAPYTGLKDEPVEPIAAMADKALAEGSADEMIKKISGHMAEAIKEKFNKALIARKKKTRAWKPAGNTSKPTSRTCILSKASTPLLPRGPFTIMSRFERLGFSGGPP